MDLREPRKKLKTRLQPQPLFPISLDGSRWRVYTAHLTDLGSCIANPDEVTAVHSMGFFGKASLSRSHPSFGRARYGAPPIIRNRQWSQRQEWLQQVKRLNEESFSNFGNDNDWQKDDNKETNSNETEAECRKEENNTNKIDDVNETENSTSKQNDNCNTDKGNKEKEENEELHSLDCSGASSEKNQRKDLLNVDEIILDSAEEEDDICVIVNRENEKHDSSESINGTDFTDFQPDETDESLNPDDYNVKNLVCANDSKTVQSKLLVLPDSDSEIEDYLQNVKPRIECESFPIRETLHLTFEETFFLLFGLGCLRVFNFDGTLLDIDNAWTYFCTKDKNFIQKYVVYHYYRSKGWVVKPGLKYGGEFLLYKQGPPFYHASYIVIIDVLNADTLTRIPEKCKWEITWNGLFGLDRLAQATAKEILFAQVLWPSSIPQDICPPTPDVLSEFTVKEVLWRKWNPKQNRDVVINDEDNDDFY